MGNGLLLHIPNVKLFVKVLAHFTLWKILAKASNCKQLKYLGI